MAKKGVEIFLLSRKDLPDTVRESLNRVPGTFIRDGRKIYYSLGKDVLCCEDVPDAYSLLVSIRNSHNPGLSGNSATDAYYQLLTFPDNNDAVQDLIRLHVRDHADRVVVLFSASGTEETDLYTSLKNIAPIEEGDVLVPLHANATALVAAQDEEIPEYVAAVLETMEGEGITGLSAGIGTTAETLSDLGKSFANASAALETGKKVRCSQRVFRYSELLLELIVDSIPANVKKEICDRMTASWNLTGLSRELMETAEIFFRSDLNLTATAKQMFIHRNTLNYRLEKIRKATGLDLQCFRDAAVFRILTQMGNIR